MLGDQDVCGLECCLEPKLQGVTSQCGGIGLVRSQRYRDVQYRPDVVPMLPKCPVPVSVLHRFRYRIRDIRQYRRRRYGYWCCSELTEVSGKGIDAVPNFPKCPAPTIPAVYTARTPRYVPYRTLPWKNVSKLTLSCVRPVDL